MLHVSGLDLNERAGLFSWTKAFREDISAIRTSALQISSPHGSRPTPKRTGMRLEIGADLRYACLPPALTPPAIRG